MTPRAQRPQPVDPYVVDGRPFVGIQVGAVSFVDEGTETVLDLFRKKAGIDAVLLACHTFDRGTGGRQIAGHPLPDHGAKGVILSRKYSERRLADLFAVKEAVR